MLQAHAELGSLLHRVQLELRGIPALAWELVTTKKLLLPGSYHFRIITFFDFFPRINSFNHMSNNSRVVFYSLHHMPH